MKVLHLSDTHGKHHLLHNLPPADMLIHSGDVSFAGSQNEIREFITWFGALPYRYKIFIAGNHDNCLFDENIERLPDKCFCLCNSGITIEDVKFYGVPMFMEDVFSDNYDKKIQEIPKGTDVLITHQPPHGILDSSANCNYGNRNLLKKVLGIKPRYHLFGHIHDAYGTHRDSHTTFVNAAVLDPQYQLVNKPVLLEV